MKYFSGVVVLLGAILAAFAFVSCDSVINPNPDGGDYEEYSVKFERQPDDTVLFATNTKSDIGPNGYTYWKIGTVEQDWSSEYEISVIKPTGSLLGGYGVLFSVPADVYTHFFVIINSARQYKIGKRKGQTVQPEIIQDWTGSGYLLDGINANSIAVTYNAGLNEYRVFFNDDPTGILVTGDPQIAPAGRLGYIAEVLTSEDFPDNPVEIRYMQVTPTDIGM